jgi:hypothetical protein
MNEITKQELELMSKIPKTDRSNIFDEVINDDEIIYLDSNNKCFRLKLLDGDISKLISMPKWMDLKPSLETLDYLKYWSKIWRNTSLYNIYTTKPELVTNLVLELSVVNEDTFNIIGEHSTHKIENIEQLNALLDYYLSKVDF